MRDKTHVTAEAQTLTGDYAVPADCDVLINATSVGLFDDAVRVPVDRATFREGLICADAVFNPPLTKFLHEAKHAGCVTLDGLGMLVNQATIGFRIWTGKDANATMMREALEEFLSL
ncbi:MAG: hypothetical protein QM811_07260 [Pirellulales bacterium]